VDGLNQCSVCAGHRVGPSDREHRQSNLYCFDCGQYVIGRANAGQRKTVWQYLGAVAGCVILMVMLGLCVVIWGRP
jgi:hypothetical protein